MKTTTSSCMQKEKFTKKSQKFNKNNEKEDHNDTGNSNNNQIVLVENAIEPAERVNASYV